MARDRWKRHAQLFFHGAYLAGCGATMAASQRSTGAATDWRISVDDNIDRVCVQVDGEVWCWHEPLGARTDAEGSRDPARLPGGPYRSSSASGHGTCACSRQGTAVCTGQTNVVNCRACEPTSLGPMFALDLPPCSVVDGRGWCELAIDGEVWCWESSLASATPATGQVPLERGEPWSSGQPLTDVGGLCHHVPRLIHVVGASGATSISSHGHTCVVLGEGAPNGSRGEVRCWGTNLLGETSDGEVIDGIVHVPIRDVDLVDVDYSSTCAVSRGAVWCWGVIALEDSRALAACMQEIRYPSALDPAGLFGPASCRRPTPLRVSGVEDAEAVAVGGDLACALEADGDLVCWGAYEDEILSPRRMAQSVVAVDLDDTSGCIIRRDGEVWCWTNATGAGAAMGSAMTQTQPRELPPGHRVAVIEGRVVRTSFPGPSSGS